MATFYDTLTEDQIAFIKRQHIFFVATASSTGRVNLSPKGMDTFRVLSPNTVAYLDMYGSGNETAAHIQHDGRVTLMFTSFDQRPNTLRLYGTGQVIRAAHPQWDEYVPHFDQICNQRQIIVAQIKSTQDSCGFSTPRLEFKNERNTLVDYLKKYDNDEMASKLASQTQSIDGLPIDLS